MANLILQNQGTIIIWSDSGGTHAFTTNNLGSGAGRQGVEHDFGVAAVPTRFAWFAQVQWNTNSVLREVIRVYLKTAPDGAHYDNDDGDGTDIAVSAEDKLSNLTFLDAIKSDQAALDIKTQISGVITIGAEKVAPVFWNASADALRNEDNLSIFYLIPIPLEVQ